MRGRVEPWEGSAGELLEALRAICEDFSRLPRSPAGMGSALARVAGMLVQEGIEVTKLDRTSQRRTWRIATAACASGSQSP